MAEKLCELKKKGGGGGTGDDLKEVIFGSRLSGQGSKYIYVTPNYTIYSTTDTITSKINSDSPYFNASGSILTTIKACDILEINSNTIRHLNVGDTITYYNSNAFGQWMIAVV